MFTNLEIEEYSNLLNILNQPNEQDLPSGYNLIAFGGGKDGIPHFKLLINQDSQIYVIWVRGTRFTDINDIKINIKTKPINFYQGECHSGYFIGAYNIIHLIMEHLNNEHINKIICLGHSLGGAVSSIIATILKKGDFGPIQNLGNIQQKFQNGIRALTFGTPPTFSESISEETNQFITNIVFKGDVVPKLGKLFEALSIFQRRKVTIQMYENNCLNTNSTKVDFSQLYTFDNLNDVQINRLPGNVILLERLKFPEEKDYFGHCFVNYRQIIKMAVRKDEGEFIGELKPVFGKVPKENVCKINKKNVYEVKHLLLGRSACGKSAIAETFKNDSFPDFLGATINIITIPVMIQTDEYYIKLNICDHSGVDRLNQIIFNKYANSQVFMIVVDTLSSIEECKERIMLYNNEIRRNNGNEAITYVCLNEFDNDIYFNYDDLIPFSEENNLQFFKISAKDVKNVNEMFENITSDIKLKCITKLQEERKQCNIY